MTTAETYRQSLASIALQGLREMEVKLANQINPALKRVEQVSQESVPVVGNLLMPVAVTGYVLALWRVAADMDWTGEFFIARGILSHWQVWLVLAGLVHILASYLNRRGDRVSS